LAEGIEEFVAGLAAGLGDSRRIFRATQYVEALLIESEEPKSFAQLARLITDHGDAAYKVEQAFQHLVNGSSWDPDALLRKVGERIAADLDVKATMLLAVVFPRLGEHEPQYPDGRKGGQQIATVLQLVGADRRGQPAILPLQWKLSLENEERWYDWRFRERAEVDYPIGVHISVLGGSQVARAVDWGLAGQTPLVAGPSYEWLRARWLQTRQWPPYVVEIPPKAFWMTQAELETLLGTRPDAPRLERLDRDLSAAMGVAAGTWSLYSLTGELGQENVIVVESSAPVGNLTKRAWCTNLAVDSSDQVADLVRLTQLRTAARGFWDEVRYGALGAAGYRGLSVKGWERHCALVSLAEAYRIHVGKTEKSEPHIPAGRKDEERNWRTKVRRIWE
jgi:hypothetical protein